jgi:hypothetical protein
VRSGESDGKVTKLAEGLASVINSRVSGPGRWGGAAPFAEIEQRMAERRGRQRLGFALIAAGAMAVAGVAGFKVRARLGEQVAQAITFTVDGKPSRPNGAAVPDVPVPGESVLSFSDGTRIEMAEHARGRVMALSARGGLIAIEDGRAHVQVAHHAGAEWLFQAGPFAIVVHGTAFSVGWSASDAHFDVQMETGVVSVKGPVSGGEIVLHAGETLSIGLHDEAPAPLTQAPPGRPAPIAPGMGAGDDTSPEPARRVGRTSARQSWPDELAEGRTAAIIEDARHLGIDAVLASRSSEDLAALADAARYRRDAALARSALLAQRRRFPGSTRAAEASFLLGRLEDESPGGPARALGWYDRYLLEAPRGAYVSEALGRKMMVLERAHRRDEAAVIAAAYMQRFPRGTYAAAAEALAHAP